jgi:catechol 2,3-dioxygenase-like lactoylglutathione lyase family enzyme
MEWNKLVPELVVANYRRSKDFYQQQFGFRLRFERVEDNFGYFDLAGAQVMLLQAPGNTLYGLERPGPNGKGLHFQVEVESIAGLLDRLQAANIELHVPVSEVWYRADAIEHGQREFFVSDPDGYLFRFYEYIGERPAG